VAETALTQAKLETRQRRVRWLDIRESLTGYLFILPAFVIIGVFGLFPIVFAFYVSLHQWRITPGAYIGLENYQKAISHLAYVIFFIVSLVLITLAGQKLIQIYQSARQRGHTIWWLFLPATVTALGIAQFIRFFILLLPEVLRIPERARGQVRSQELFLRLLGEAWQTPAVQEAFTLAIGILLGGVGLFLVMSRYYPNPDHSLEYSPSLLLAVLLLGCGGVLGWYVISEVQRVYAMALQSGTKADIWAQVVTILAGFVLLLLSWLTWRRASERSSHFSLLLHLFAAIVFAIGAWILIGELPRIIAAGDRQWWNGLKVTAFYSFGTVPVQISIALLLATLLFEKIRGRALFRLIYFLPYITPDVASAAVFRVFFSSRPTAPINNLLSQLGFEPLLWLDEPKGIFELLFGSHVGLPNWAAGPSLALVVIILYNIWSFVGYDTVVFLAGLSNISPELYEAAEIDGAGRWAQFRYITLPLLSPTTYFLTLIAVIGTFKAFNHVWILRSAAALGTTDTASIVIFNEFSRNTRYGYAASLSIVLLGVILVLTIINNRIARERVFYG
jgi:multiple sugar transport system permease protein